MEVSNTEEIILDSSSGISLEEQQEILKVIDAIADINRLGPDTSPLRARKKGFLFPLLVNLSALVILGLGFTLLLFYNTSNEQDIRESSSALGLTERRLIQEIRQETNRLIGEKEEEINHILLMLSEADSEYRMLQASVEDMTEAQLARAAYLQSSLEEYRLSLQGLQDERTRIIEDSRREEAILRAQAEERSLELGAQMEELRQLGQEQDRLNRAEDQMLGFYITVNNQINNNELDEASITLEAMRMFLNAPSLQGLRNMEALRQSHLAAIAAMENAIAATGGSSLSLSRALDQDEAISELQARYAALEERSAGLERDIDVFISEGSEQARIMEEYANQISRLEGAAQNQEARINQQAGELAALNNRAQEAETALAEQQRENNDLAAERDASREERDQLQQRLDAVLEVLEN